MPLGIFNHEPSEVSLLILCAYGQEHERGLH